jgi:hypothetical protein
MNNLKKHKNKKTKQIKYSMIKTFEYLECTDKLKLNNSYQRDISQYQVYINNHILCS